MSEPAVYEDANVVTTGLTDQEVEQLQNQPSKPKPSSCVAKKRLSSNNLGVGENSSSSVGVSCPPPPSSSISASTAQHHPYLSVCHLVHIIMTQACDAIVKHRHRFRLYPYIHCYIVLSQILHTMYY